MTNLDLTKKLQIFFGDFSCKDIGNIYNISLDSLPQTIKNEIKIYPQKDFVFVEYIANETHKDKRLGDLTKMARYGIAENMETAKQIILTNDSALLNYLLYEVAVGKIKADDIVLYYRESNDELKYYVKREEMGKKFKAYFVDGCGKKVDNLCSCENERNF